MEEEGKNDIKSPRTLFFHIKEDENFRISRNWRAIMRLDSESSIEARAAYRKNRVLEISITGEEGKSDNVARFGYNGASTNLPQNNTSPRDGVQAWLHLTQEWGIEQVDAPNFSNRILTIVPSLVSVEFGLSKLYFDWIVLSINASLIELCFVLNIFYNIIIYDDTIFWNILDESERFIYYATSNLSLLSI